MASNGVVVTGPSVPGADWVLTDDALDFVADLQRRFGQVRLDLLRRRQERQAELDAGVMPDFLPGTPTYLQPLPLEHRPGPCGSEANAWRIASCGSPC